MKYIKRLYKSSVLVAATTVLIACGSSSDTETGASNNTAPRQAAELEITANPTTANAAVAQQDYALPLAKALADTWLDTYQPGQNAWSWGAGVMMMGIMDLYEVTGDQRYYQYAKEWIDYHMENGYFITSSDNSIPGYTALRIYEIEQDPKYLDIGHEVWHYISVEAGRTSEGGLNHLGLVSGNQIWVDSLFMIGPFLMKYAEITGLTEPYDEYALQFNVFRKNLRDPATGLYRHMYDDTKKVATPEEPHFWGRGNGWVYVGYQVASNHLPESVQSSLGFSIAADSSQMLDTFKANVAPDGRFHTIINAPETYLETSAGLLYAYALLYNMDAKGQVEPEQQALAEEWLQGAINQTVVDAAGNTLLLGTSYGTSPGTLEYYNQVIKGENVGYGVGLYLLAASTREKIGKAQALTEPSGEPTEAFIQPPVPCEGVACGKFHIARGNFTQAINEFSKEPSSEGSFYTAAIETIRLGFDAFYQIDRLASKDIDGKELIEWVNTYAFDKANSVNRILEDVVTDQSFQSTLDRLLILESGGQSAIGAREFDQGEAHLFKAIAQVVTGVALITGADPSLLEINDQPATTFNQALLKHPWKQDNNTLQGLLKIVEGMDSLIAALEVIDAEADDQSDDFVPSNVVRLEGTFSIPGLLLETDIKSLLTGLGLSEDDLEKLEAPGDLVALLKPIASTIKVVATLLELVM